MRRKIFVMLVVMLLATHSLCFGEAWNRSGSASVQKAVGEEKPAGKQAAKVEIYVTDW